MNASSLERIRVTAPAYGAGPGMGGTSYMEFVHTARRWKVFGGGTAFEESEELGSLPKTADWQDRVRFILEEQWPAHEDQRPEDIQVIGTVGVEAQMLALAWAGPAGADAAALLMQLADHDLFTLEKANAICSEECVNARQLMNELLHGDDEKSLDAIRRAISAEIFSWDAACKEAARLAVEIEEEEHRSIARRKQMLQPFEEEISRLVSSWCALTGGASSSINQMGVNSQRNGLRSSLEDFAVTYGKLPEGEHRVTASIMGTRLDFTVDIDTLRRFGSASLEK